MTRSRNAWDSRRTVVALGMVSNVIGALAAAGAAIAAWLTTMNHSDLTQWALILAGIGGVFVAKGSVILAIAESRPYAPQDGVPELERRLSALENRLSARNSGVVERIEQLEAEIARLRVRG
ncbi:hypothetical protein [Devosia riboflavina]|nr:hypothetical protein [Devosia riboflavina]